MRRRLRPCLVILSPLLALLAAGQAGLRVNHSGSFPPGIYWVIPKRPEKGDLVLFRPPALPAFDLALERGYIGSGGLVRYECLLKRVVALEGDTVSISTAGVYVNGRKLTNSAPLPCDLSGRSLPVCRLDNYRLRPGEVLLMSDYSKISFDSRYFGPIRRAQIQTVVQSVWTW